MEKQKRNNTALYMGVAALSLLFLRKKNIAGIGAFNKDFYDVMSSFERSINKITYTGSYFEKEAKELIAEVTEIVVEGLVGAACKNILPNRLQVYVVEQKAAEKSVFDVWN